MARLAIIDEDSEHIRAAYWRRRIMLMNAQQFADAVGWSWGVVYQHERGEVTEPAAWRKYKNACAGLHARKYGWERGKVFDWRL